MNRYRALQSFTADGGAVLQLTPDQAKTRAHHLEKLDEGRYRAQVHVQFKRGEEFGMEGELAKGHEPYLELVQGAKPEWLTEKPVGGSAPAPGKAAAKPAKAKAAPKGKKSKGK